MVTCEGTWPQNLVFFVFFENGPQIDLIGAGSHTETENGTPLFRQKELIVKNYLI